MSAVTLEQVESLAMQLPTAERLKLAARICERASAEPPMVLTAEEERKEREEKLQKLLAILDAAASQWHGTFDAAEDIHQMREERDEQLWPSR